MKILIAEDDKFLSNAYIVKMTKAGMDITLASDGAEAITHLEKETPDLIVLDLVMPNKDGFTTLEEIQANAEWKKIPVLVASNLGQQEDIDKALSLGAKDFVIKSNLSMDELLEKIKKLANK